MKRAIWFFFISAFFFLSGCAYFNVFYNARGYYNKGYEETRKNRTGKPTSGETQNYQKAIEKAAKLIAEYPESKWVDDALLMMGKAYYYQQQYMRSNRKFVELLTNYPNSEFVPEAKLWLAKTDLSLEKYPEAEQEFRSLLKQDLPKELIGEANFYLGQLYSTQDDYRRAVEAYENAAKNVHKDMRAATLFEVGANYDSLGVYDKAAEAFDAVLKNDPIQELKQDARFRYTQMRKKMGAYDEAIKEFEMMLLDQRNQTLFPKIRLEIAECLARKGDTRGALLAYQDITQEFKGNDGAEAYFRMGRLYETRERDYDRALEQFKQVKPTSARSVFADSAEIMARDIERYKALEMVIDMGLRGESGRLIVQEEKEEEDTLDVTRFFTMIDTTKNDSVRRVLIANLRGQAFLDSLTEEDALAQDQRNLPQWRDRLEKRETMGGVDWIAWLENGSLPTDEEMEEELVYLERYRLKSKSQETIRSAALSSFKVEEIDKNLFYLSELYLFRFHLPDSAAKEYRLIVSRFPESPLAPQALFNLAYISTDIHRDTTAADTAYRRIVEDYPDSRFAPWSREWLGLPVAEAKKDSLEQIFHEAEKALFQRNDPQAAYRTFEAIYENHPDTKWGAKSFYAMGWLSEHRLDSLQLAYALYNNLSQRYPESVYAKHIQPKIQAVMAAEREKAASQSQPSDSSTVELKQPVKVGDEADSPPDQSDELVPPEDENEMLRNGPDADILGRRMMRDRKGGGPPDSSRAASEAPRRDREPPPLPDEKDLAEP